MDRVSACGAGDEGSNPSGGTFNCRFYNFELKYKYE